MDLCHRPQTTAMSTHHCFSTPGFRSDHAPITPAGRDYSQEKPIGNETFEIFRRMYAYDTTTFAATTEGVDDSNDLWRKETASYAAAYGGERIPAYLFLPK